MIVPDVDLETATDDEIVAAYIREGFSEATARIYLAQLRNTDPRFQD
ncbi:MAG: hypothetical protein ABI632_05715 [Pseudolysinimonas sp.]